MTSKTRVRIGADDSNFCASPVRPGQPNFPTVIKHSGDIFDYSGGDLHRLGVGETVLSKLEVSDGSRPRLTTQFDNEEVLRIIINSHKIESTLVAPTDDDALNIINRTVGVQYPRINVVTAREFQHMGQLKNE